MELYMCEGRATAAATTKATAVTAGAVTAEAAAWQQEQEKQLLRQR
jgi:hypothetical protein